MVKAKGRSKEEKHRCAVLFLLAEMQGFEPWHGQNPPAGFRIRSLQPLGYISILNC